MAFDPFDVTTPHIFYACLGGFVVLFGMFSLFLREKLYIGEACWAFLFGVIIGPYGANIFDPRSWGGHSEETTNTITLEFARVVLAIGVFAIGVELPKAYMYKHWKSLAFLLAPVMTWGWFVSAGLIYALIPSLNFLSALAVAACLTPTDPILAAAVVGGKYADKHVPAHIRHLLAAESGCNDGAAFPFLYIALYLILDQDTGTAVKDWFLLLWVYQVILGVAIGSLVGFGFRHLMKFCERNNFIDRQSYVAQYISLAVLTIGVTTLLGSDDLLSAFSCGTAFAWDGFFNRQTEESVFSSVIDLLFNIAAFVYVGAWMPFNDFEDLTLTLTPWRLIVTAILVLILRRLPIMLALYRWIPDVKTFREAIFSGHFGPIGIGGVFISTLAAQKLPTPSNPPANQTEMLAATIQPIVAFMVLCSIIIHGLSIPSFSLGRRVHTVSRTWSRHAPAEWINQARRVENPEDIVINRDDNALERGESKEKVVSQRESTVEGSPSSLTIKEEPIENHNVSETVRIDEETMKEENIPDGGERVSEWREGPHKLIERRAGPGEEVNVEVTRNFYAANEVEQPSSTFHGTEASAGHHMTDKLRPAHHGLEKGINEVEHAGLEGMEEKSKQTLAPPAILHDDDDGWASDGSDRPHASTSGSTENEKKSSKSSKQKHSSKSVGMVPRKGRRRTSMRKGMWGRAYLMKQQRSSSGFDSQDSDGEEANGHEEDDSGRSKSGVPAHRSRSLRNLRIDTIIRGTRSRDDSPSRSIRFADEVHSDDNRSGYHTPRSPDSHLHNGSVDEPDSVQRVTSELSGSPK